MGEEALYSMKIDGSFFVDEMLTKQSVGEGINASCEGARGLSIVLEQGSVTYDT